MKTILTTVFLILIQHLSFSQDIKKITITADNGYLYHANNINDSIDIILRTDPVITDMGNESIKLVYDLINMKTRFYSSTQDSFEEDIVKFEILPDGTIHIIVDELNIMYPEKDNIRILTHKYINRNKGLSVYKWTWKSQSLTCAVSDNNPRIIFE